MNTLEDLPHGLCQSLRNQSPDAFDVAYDNKWPLITLKLPYPEANTYSIIDHLTEQGLVEDTDYVLFTAVNSNRPIATHPEAALLIIWIVFKNPGRAALFKLTWK